MDIHTFANVKSMTLGIFPGHRVVQMTHGNTVLWEEQKVEPFYIKNTQSNRITLQITKSTNAAPTLVIEMSTDGANWSSMGVTSTTAIQAYVPANGKLYLRCNANDPQGYNAWAISQAEYNTITALNNATFNVGGNIMSLLYGSNFTGDERTFPSGSTYNFYRLFYNARIIDASKLILPATTLTQYCYGGMFEGCGLLTNAPALPATTLAQYCYFCMFKSCLITNAPALPATTLAQNCYASMFMGCTELTTAPDLPATTLAQYCYASMFRDCTSLTTAPDLPATTLATYCYALMFFGCTELNYIKCLATDKSASNCTVNWVNGVAATGTFIKDPNITTSTWTTGYAGIPSGWTVQDAA